MSDLRHLLGVYAHTDALAAALRGLNAKRLTIAEVYTPVNNEEIIALATEGRSPVRYATFTGAVAGLVTGLGLALLTTAVWDLATGGKPVYSIVPFLVVGFELSILLGALATLAGLLIFARLPDVRFPAPGYRPSFTDDQFGVWVSCPPDRVGEARELLSSSGAVEVQEIDAEVNG